ncbi:gamma-glutamylcyclotransferase [Geobacillus phage GR1]|nr:gamma-glutamylcyclotransferase [Geobacillus phage GR1]
MMNKFFVYGTLMSGMSNHNILIQEAIENIEPAIVEKKDLYIHECGRFPCMLEGTGKVLGEIITIKPEYLNISIKLLDRLEGYYGLDDDMNLYHRILSHCKAHDGSLIECYMYLYNHKRKGLGEPINDGDFRKHMVGVV